MLRDVILIFLLLIFLTSCNNDAYLKSSSVSNITSGHFIDDPVEGLSYICSSETTSKKTDKNGTFECKSGDTLSFFLNGVKVGSSIENDSVLTPYSIFPNNIDGAANFARLLQTIDTNSSSHILIDKTLEVLIPTSIDFSSLTFDSFINSSDINKTLVSKYDALLAMNTAIEKEGISIPDIAKVPVVVQGEDQNVSKGSVVNLDANNSKYALTYVWNIVSKPEGSLATLSDPNSSKTSFVADKVGTYLLNIVITNNIMQSTPKTLKVIASNTLPTQIFDTFTTKENTQYTGTLTGSDSNNDKITFEKVSDVTHGVLTFNENGNILYMPDNNYIGEDSFSYKIFDGFEYSEIKIVKITVLNLNEAIVISNSNNITVDENILSSFTIQASSADNNPLVYGLLGDESRYFTINDKTGYISFISPPDYEIKNIYQFSATVKDNIASVTKTMYITINIKDIPEVPVLKQTTLYCAEDVSTGSSIGKITISSIGDSDIDSITLSGAGSENFVVSNDGSISLKPNASLDYEIFPSYSLNAVAKNASGSSSIVKVDIIISDISDTLPQLLNTILSVRESSIGGSSIGYLSISKIGDTAISSIILTGEDSEKFHVATDGLVTLSSNPLLDYETKSEYNLTAVAKNVAGYSNNVNLDIFINNSADTTPILSDSTINVNENMKSNAKFGTISISGTGDSSIVAIKISGEDNEYFKIDNSGNIFLTGDNLLNYEAKKKYSFDVIASNSSGDSNLAKLTINVNNIIEKPILKDSEVSIAENEIKGSLVGKLTILDKGDGDITSITLSGDGNEKFLASSDGNITLANGNLIDFETKSLYNLTVSASNSIGESESVKLDINIEDAPFDPMEIAKINDNTQTNTKLGNSVSVSGNKLVVGIPYKNKNNTQTGGAFVYKKVPSDNSLVKVGELLPSDLTANSHFGYSVSVSGNFVAVGAPDADNKGAVYLFQINDEYETTASVVQTAKIQAPDLQDGDKFGYSVSMSGGYVAIGSPNANANSGKVYIYRRNSDNTNDTTKLATLVADDNQTDDMFGSSVSMDDNYIAIGSPYQDTTANDAGKVYLFEKITDTNIPKISKFQSSDIQADDNFGKAVSISGKYIVIGASNNSSYLFKRNSDTSTTQIAKILADDAQTDSEFGSSVSIDGDYIAIGAYNNLSQGSAYIFKRDLDTNDGIIPIKRIESEDIAYNDNFASSISISGNNIAIGATNKDSAYLFDAEALNQIYLLDN